MDDKKEAVPKTEPATPSTKAAGVTANPNTTGGSGSHAANVGAGAAGAGAVEVVNRGGGNTGGGGVQGYRRGGGGRFFGNQRGGGGGTGGGSSDRGGSGGGRGNMRGGSGNNFDDNRRGGGGGGGGRYLQRDGGNSGSGSNLQRDHNRHQQNHNNLRDDDHLGGGGGGGGGRNLDRQLHDKLMEITGPTFELPPLDTVEKKFSGRSRLYIGNIPPDVSEEELTEKFKKYGEISELFLNREKNFGFIRLDYHCNAERAKNELSGTVIKNRTLKIRFAPNGSMLKVKNLDEHVTNELLHLGFSVFGDIDRAVVVLDDRGKPTGEGLVEFSRKNSALFAVRKCTDGCFFLTKNIRPVLVELYEATDENDGYSDRFANKKHPEYLKNRSIGPRIAPKDSFEHDYGMRWKQLYELHKQKMQALNKELEIDQNKLIAQMEYARYEHDTAMLREQLRAREMDMDRQKREWEMKQQQAEDDRRRADEHLRRQEEEIQSRMQHQEEEMRRRQQENNLFLQAQQLNNMLDHQEQVYAGNGGGGNVAGGGDIDSNLFNEVNMDGIMDQKQGGFGGKGGGAAYADRMGGGGGGGGGAGGMNSGGGSGNADRMGGGNKQHGGYGGGARANDRGDRNDGGGMRGGGMGNMGSGQHRGNTGSGGGGSARGGGGDSGGGGNFWMTNNDNYGHNKRRRF